MKGVLKNLAKKPDTLFLISLFLIISLIYSKKVLFMDNLEWEEVEDSSYIYTGKYKLSEITVAELDMIPGISLKVAQNIFKDRDKIKRYGDFLKVKGVGPSRLNILKDYILIE